MTFAALPLDGARFAQRFKLALEPGDPFLHATTIDFQLCFTRTAHADSAGLTRKVFPHASQARQKILQLRQLDLQTAFATARALGKNIENQLRAIEDLAREQ